MNRLFDWAIFGEINRRHGLIDSSLPIEMRDRLSGLAPLSDRPSSDPPPGTTPSPYLSGFPYDCWYVLMRTFLDPTAPRGGMVRSFCLLLPSNELEKINDLSILIDCLPATESSPSEWHYWKDRNLCEARRERKPADLANLTPLSIRLGLIDALLTNQLPGVWADCQDKFECVLVSVWALLPAVFRSILRFGRSYSPNDLGEPRPHFVTTPRNTAARWDQAKILKPLEREPNSRAEFLLLQYGNADRSLPQFLCSLPVIREFHRLKLANDCLEAFDDAEQGEISQAVEAAVLLNSLAPELQQATELKERSISTLENILRNADIRDIRYFANLRLESFAAAEQRLGRLLNPSVNRHLAVFNNINREFVEWAFEERTAVWWRNAVSSAIVEQVKNLSSALASSLWNWWLNQPELVLRLREHLPSHADALLYETAPTEIDGEKAQTVLEMFSQNLNLQSNAFPRLLTYLQVVVNRPNDQILQSCLKRSSEVDVALNTFRKCIGAQVFLDLALTVLDERVLQEAGTCCFEEPTLLNQIASDNVAWRKIWLVAIQAGANPLAGILYPNQVMANLLDELLLGHPIDKNLLICLSYTSAANLIDYSSRTKIWSVLPLEAKIGFLEATAKGVFELWCEDSNVQPEPELTENLLKPRCFTEAAQKFNQNLGRLTSNYIAFLVSSKSNISNAQEVMQVLCHNTLEISDLRIKQFAEWIRQNRWTSIAEMAFECYQRAGHSMALYLLVENTLEILPWLTRLHAMIALRQPTAQNDFYSSLRKILVELFSKGPNTDGFWDDVGGQPGDLKVNGTVAEAWYSAIAAIQQGRVSLDRVIKLARERYPHHSELRELERLSRKL
ncbi:MAG: hypothetical protein HY785_22725 [Oscillatoriophycideae cyanobacterium NC_groundwater_1537_Pr4_S-0.65um_50_18]|nr:hypothetical protein [Oscillatoriophycideae cyanobacterium NC_groundwater_1537_Pr4_S-0.65um_50_18]